MDLSSAISIRWNWRGEGTYHKRPPPPEIQILTEILRQFIMLCPPNYLDLPPSLPFTCAVDTRAIRTFAIFTFQHCTALIFFQCFWLFKQKFLQRKIDMYFYLFNLYELKIEFYSYYLVEVFINLAIIYFFNLRMWQISFHIVEL